MYKMETEKLHQQASHPKSNSEELRDLQEFLEDILGEVSKSSPADDTDKPHKKGEKSTISTSNNNFKLNDNNSMPHENIPDVSFSKKTSDAVAERNQETRRHREANGQNRSAIKNDRAVKTNEENLTKVKYSNNRSLAKDTTPANYLDKFFTLHNDFVVLSQRLDKADVHPKASRRLNKAINERQRLMTMLSKIGSGKRSDDNDDVQGKQEIHTAKKYASGSKKLDEEFGMLKKTKSVHWSDELLGGNIIKETDGVTKEETDSLQWTQQSAPKNYSKRQSTKSNPKETVEYHKEIESHAVETSNRNNTEMVYQSKYNRQPPPSYPHYNTNILNDGEDSRRYDVSSCDRQGSLCSIGVGHAVHCVEEMLNEAAALRNEACYMLWRARYLEQISATETFQPVYPEIAYSSRQLNSHHKH